MLTPFLALVRKDLKLFFGDRRALLMTVAAPILIASFFGYIFGGRSGQTKTSRIPVFSPPIKTEALFPARSSVAYRPLSSWKSSPPTLSMLAKPYVKATPRSHSLSPRTSGPMRAAHSSTRGRSRQSRCCTIHPTAWKGACSRESSPVM